MERPEDTTLPPRRIAGVYLLFGVVWIVVTDWLVVTIFDSPDAITTAQTAKGWVFVALSGAVVFGLTKIRQREIRQSRDLLDRMNQQLQVLQRVFRHNIRNEITVIRGHLDLAQSGEQTADLEKAIQRTEAVTRLSDKMQVVSDVEIADIARERVDLVSLTDDAIGAIERTYPAATITVETPGTAEIYGDTALHRGLYELLENAIVHNSNLPEDREVHVSIRENEGDVSLSIRDNGAPIPDHEVAPLQAEEETKLTHTSGVGLWIAKWLCEYCRGDLLFDTDDGTTVRLTFTAVDVAEAETTS